MGLREMLGDEVLGIKPDPEADRRAAALVANDHEFLAALVRLRRAHDLTQDQIAQRMGVSQSAVAHIEGGRRDAKLSTIRRYAMAVGAVVEHKVAAADKGVAETAGLSHYRPLTSTLMKNALWTDSRHTAMKLFNSTDYLLVDLAAKHDVSVYPALFDTVLGFTADEREWVETARAASQVEDPVEA